MKLRDVSKSIKIKLIVHQLSLMISILFSTLPFFTKKSPRFLGLIMSFISFMLALFVLLGCTKPKSAYANVFLFELSFNQSSPILKNMQTDTMNSTQMDTTVRTGYMGSCITFNASSSNSKIECGDTDKIFSKYASELPVFSLYNEATNSTTEEMNLVDFSSSFRKSGSNVSAGGFVPLVILIVIEIIGMAVNAASVGLRFTKFSVLTYIIAAAIGFSCWILSIATLSWIEAQRNTIHNLVHYVSLGLLNGSVDGRMSGIEWATFFMTFLQGSIGVFFCWKEAHKEVKDEKRQVV